jgi:sulfur-oxidizing protein SoxX
LRRAGSARSRPRSLADLRALEHDPEKWVPVLGKRSCSSNIIERDGDSKRSYLAIWTLLIASIAAVGAAGPARAQAALAPYEIAGDAISKPLTDQPGDPARGRAIVTNRQVGLCLLCHSGPFDDKFQGDLAPDLTGAGSRWSAGQLRLRIVDASRINPATIMPPYYRVKGLARVAAPFRGRPVLSAEQIEDVVAFLTTLRQ